MNAFVLHDVSDRASVRRWGASAMAIVAAHAALIALALSWTTQRPVLGVSLPAIMVDMAPVTSAPQPTQMDLAPGPVMQQADASPPPEAAQQETVQEQLAPTPPQEKPEVVAPPEQKTEPTPPKPEPAKIVPDRKPSPVKPKVVRAKAKRPNVRRRRRRQSAPVLRPQRSRPTTSAWPHICNASSSTRRPPRLPGSAASRGCSLRLAAAVRCSRAGCADRRGMPRSTRKPWRWSAGLSLFRRFPLT